MPRPTLENRRHFKSYVRYYKNKFTDVIQDITLYDIDTILSEKSVGLSTTTPVKFIIFDKYDIVDVTSLKENGDYIYLPALPYDVITLRVNNIDYDFSFTNTDDGGIIYNGTTYQLNDTINLPGIGITVSGLGGALLSLSPGLPVPSYTVGVGTTTINEGESISFTVETVNVGSGTTLYYEIVPTNLDNPIVGVGISSSDFLDASLTSSFNIVSTGATTGIATITKTLINDFNSIEGNETFVLTILKDSQTIVAISTTITVVNQGLPSFNIGISTNEITEGESVVFTVNSNNTVGIGTLYFTTSGTVSAEDFVDSSLIGSFNIVSTGATTGIATITRTITNDLETEGTETFNLEIRAGSASTISGTLVATSSTVYVSNAPIPTFDVGISTTTINEGDAVEFTVNTTGFSTSIPLYYSTGGSVTASDFTDSSLTGSFNLVSTGATTGVATIARTLAYDFESGAADTFNLSIRTGSTSGTVVATSSTITVNNLTPSYTITSSTTTINEGSSVDFTINTVNVGAGSTLYYSTDGNVSTADFSDGSLTGSFLIVGTGATTGIATVTRSLLNDLSFESSETFNFVVRTQSTSGTVVATSSTITVNNVVPTFTLTPSTDSANEGSSVVFTVTTTGVPNGSILYWTTLTTLGTVSASDFTDNALSGSFTVNNNTGSIARSITSDRTTETEEKFKLELRTTSTSGTIVATSDEVTINDTSLNVGDNSNGLTFGPVQVNRDGGNPALASDWYTICGIDELPEGSSIALFIDTSGSMTQATIQASYNLLVEKLNAKNITITSVTNPDEDWITPFLVDLP